MHTGKVIDLFPCIGIKNRLDSRKMEMKVREAMRTNSPTVLPDASFAEIAQKMLETRADAIAVCDQQRFLGIVTGSDLLNLVSRNNDEHFNQKAISISREYTAISPDDDSAVAVQIMARNHVGVVPVVSQEKLVGVVTLNSLARQSLALAASVIYHTLENTELVP